MDPNVKAVFEPVVAAVRPTVQHIFAALPPPVINQAINLLGPSCYTHLAIQFDPLSHVECVRTAVSKSISLAIVATSIIVKLPQVGSVLKAGSAKGVSFLSIALELASQLIGAAYAAHTGLPFSAYGETIFVAVQNLVLSGLVLSYGPGLAVAVPWVGIVIAAAIGLATVDLSAAAPVLTAFQMASVPLAIVSKLPQIVEIWSAGTTGQLNAFGVFMSLLGSVARIFTTLNETSDLAVLSGHIVSVFFNIVLASQMAYYWSSTTTTKTPVDSQLEKKDDPKSHLLSPGYPDTPFSALNTATSPDFGSKSDTLRRRAL